MTDALNQTIAQTINNISTFAADKAPVLAEEILKMGMIENVSSGIIFLILSICSVLCFIFFINQGVKFDDEDHKLANNITVSFISSIICIIITIMCSYDILKIKISPNKYILDKIISQTK